MKIAVISDLHANPLALEAVLDDIKKFKADKIFCLGDLILAGYDPNKACSMIFDLKNEYKDDFKIIQGNTDKMIAFCNDDIIDKTINAYACMGYSLQDDVKITDKKYIEFVKDLPEKLRVNINGLKLDLVHGSPRSQNENIYPSLDSNLVEEMVSKSDADIILCGHTHIPCGYSLKSGKTVINAGSIGRSMTEDKMPVYLQLTIDKNAKFFVEHKSVKYDNISVQKKILKRNLKHIEDLANMYV